MNLFDKEEMQKDMKKTEARGFFADMLMDMILENSDNESHRTDMLIFKTAKQIAAAVNTITSSVYLPDDRLDEKKQALEYMQMCLGGIQTFIGEHPFLKEIEK